MRSRILFVGLALAVCLPIATSALTLTSDVQAQIDRYMAQIKELSAEIARLRGIQVEVPTPKPDPFPRGVKHRICVLLARDLIQGVEGDDVRGLQEFLSENGFFGGNATGFFGPVTEQAVAKWQSHEGITSIGRFGPLSRERLLKWCSGVEVPGQRFSATPPRGIAPLAVTFSTWLSGFRPPSISFKIDFGDGSSEAAASCYAPTDFCQNPGTNTHMYASNGTYTATLNKITDPCAGIGASSTPCAAAVHSEVIGRAQVVVGPITCTEEYQPVCGSKQVTCITTPCNPVQQTYSNRCMMAADGATFVHVGACRSFTNPADDPQCKRWTDGRYCGETCFRQERGGSRACSIPMCLPVNPVPTDGPARCLEYFGGTGNRPPVVSGFSGPTTLNVNQTGTWSVSAADPENGPLTYQVLWGDEGWFARNLLDAAFGAPAFIQNTTFTHSYASAGTYIVAVIAQDSSGATARTTTTVRVGTVDTPIACTLEYNPVCGQPPFTCNAPQGAACAMVMPATQTYSNRCTMNAAGATFVHEGACQSPYRTSCQNGGTWYDEGYRTTSIVSANGTISSIADAYYVCRGGQWKIEGGLPVGLSCSYGGQQYEEGGTYTTRTSCPNSASTFLADCSATYICRSGQWQLKTGSSTSGGSVGVQCEAHLLLADNGQCVPRVGTADGSCWFNNQLIKSGSWIVAYEKQFVAGSSYGQPCKMETRMCQNGSLSGSHAYPTCMASDLQSGA